MARYFASVILSISILSMAIFDTAEAGTRCISVKGKLICNANQSRAMDTEIRLMDDDGVMNPDDQAGWTTSNEDGTFKVEGCAYDLGSDPDPFLYIYNACNGDTTVKTRVTLPYTFTPETIDAGEIILDL